MNDALAMGLSQAVCELLADRNGFVELKPSSFQELLQAAAAVECSDDILQTLRGLADLV